MTTARTAFSYLQADSHDPGGVGFDAFAVALPVHRSHPA